ncbi:sensor histidine kinase [Acanthopleuribacter pedis]|uniref:histidine kinase n=1 Tax=Acanthopleuribacter pedis TaxID=442870 RepID=A0A8J7Q1A9_9BACT|nr:PAS domain-containing protein [Acanthopleuribacter pedis]MBO1317285.1 PAS domain-containing protein [Acanthopleuribacter pedis]MBO1318592.1 PAS domain-containing protein [Acanthopleuribacter pedis]
MNPPPHLKREVMQRLANDEALFDWFEAAKGEGLWYRDLTRPDNLWFSDGYFKLLGYATPPEQHPFRLWEEAMHEEDRDTHHENLANLLEDDTAPSDDILRFRNQEGHVLWLRARARTVRDEKDQLVGMLCTVANLTPLIQAEHQLETLTDELYEINQRHTLALKASGIGIWDYDSLNDVLIWSPEMYDLYQVAPEQFNHNYAAWLDLVLPSDRKRTETLFEKVVAKGEKKFVTEFRVVTKDMSIRTIGVNANIFYRDGHPFRVLGANWDLTETREREWVLQQRSHELKRSNRDLEEFATIASSDLQEPLRKIHGFTELLIEECSDAVSEDGRLYLERIADAGSRMEQLIGNLLEISQVSHGDLEPAPVSLGTLIKKLKSESEATIHLSCDALPTFTADRHLLHQVFFHLLHNSHQFRKKGTVATIHVQNIGLVAHQGRSFWEIRWLDQGIGLEPAECERIFKPFERLHQGGREHGAGIGLTLCRKIMERHGGWISAENHGGGAVFRLLFPETSVLKTP